MPRLPLYASLLAAALCACTPPTERQRLDFQVLADGRCTLQGQPVGCLDAGPQAAARYGARRISAVLLFAEAAPHDSELALRAGLQAAHISHVQVGLPAAASGPAAAGLD
jgi:hypothetical protein